MDLLRGTLVVGRQNIFIIDLKQVPVILRGLLPALGRCRDMVHIGIYPTGDPLPSGRVRPVWTRGEYIQMVQMVQENGAAGLWSFELQVHSSTWPEHFEAIRIGWLDVPQQPTLKGEWRFSSLF